MLGNTCSWVVPCGVLWSAGSCCVTRWARSAIATCSLLLRLDACLCSHQTQPTQPTASRTTHPSTIQVVARRRTGFFLVTSWGRGGAATIFRVRVLLLPLIAMRFGPSS